MMLKILPQFRDNFAFPHGIVEQMIKHLFSWLSGCGLPFANGYMVIYLRKPCRINKHPTEFADLVRVLALEPWRWTLRVRVNRRPLTIFYCTPLLYGHKSLN